MTRVLHPVYGFGMIWRERDDGTTVVRFDIQPGTPVGVDARDLTPAPTPGDDRPAS